MNGTESFRAKLGSRLVFWSTMALTGLAAVIMIGAIISEVMAPGGGQVMNAAQLLLTALLPLFGTWVGTILAFYYTKDSYESASQGTLDVMRSVTERLTSTPVSETMMPRSKIVTEKVPAGKTIADLAIKTVDGHFGSIGASGQKISRLLMLDAGDACIGILHRSVYNESLALGLQDAPPVDPATDTLSKLLPKPYPSKVGTTFDDFVKGTIAFVAEDRSVAEAKAAMEQVPHCQDVIVTKTGSRSDPIVGWISNVDISRVSRA